MELFRKIFSVFLIFSWSLDFYAEGIQDFNVDTIFEVLRTRKEYASMFDYRFDYPENIKALFSKENINGAIHNFTNLINEKLNQIGLNINEIPTWIEEEGKKSYVQKIVIEDGDKVIVMGDIHGSVHSLCRNLLNLIEMGYLDTNLKLKEKTYLVCIGDYVDRGRYGIEILYLLMNLKIKNPQQIVLLRGNHESVSMSSNFGFSKEVKNKYDNLILNKSYSVFQLLPLALFIGKSEEFIMICHGGLPVNIDIRGERKFDDSFFKEINDFLLGEEK